MARAANNRQFTHFNPCSFPTDHCDDVATEITCILMRLFEVIPADINIRACRQKFDTEISILFRMFCAMKGLPSDHTRLYTLLHRESLPGDIRMGMGESGHVYFQKRWLDDALLSSFGVRTVLRAEILVIFIRVVVVALVYADANNIGTRAMTPVWDGSRTIGAFSPEFEYENYKYKLLTAVFRFLLDFKLFVLSDEVRLTKFDDRLVTSFVKLCDITPRATHAYMALVNCFSRGTEAHCQVSRAIVDFSRFDIEERYAVGSIAHAGYIFSVVAMTDWRGICEQRREVIGRMVGICSLVFIGSVPRFMLQSPASARVDELDDAPEMPVEEDYPSTWFGPNRTNRSKFPRLQHQTSVGQKSD